MHKTHQIINPTSQELPALLGALTFASFLAAERKLYNLCCYSIVLSGRRQGLSRYKGCDEVFYIFKSG